MVQQLGFCAFTAEVVGSVAAQRTKILQALWLINNKEKE